MSEVPELSPGQRVAGSVAGFAARSGLAASWGRGRPRARVPQLAGAVQASARRDQRGCTRLGAPAHCLSLCASLSHAAQSAPNTTVTAAGAAAAAAAAAAATDAATTAAAATEAAATATTLTCSCYQQICWLNALQSTLCKELGSGVSNSILHNTHS